MNAQEGLELNHEILAEKYRPVKKKIHESGNEQAFDYSNRMYRALSWLKRAEQMKEEEDIDLAFIVYWIAFNAAYGEYENPKEIVRDERKKEKEKMKLFLNKIVECSLKGGKKGIMQDIFHTLKAKQKMMAVLKNIHIDEQFWHELPNNYSDVQRIDTVKKNVEKRVITGLPQRMMGAEKGGRMDIEKLMRDTFYNLYTLRNQIMHGGATLRSSVNRRQIEDGLEVIAYFVPRIINVMLEHPNPSHYSYWGRLAFPVYEKEMRDEVRQRKDSPKPEKQDKIETTGEPIPNNTIGDKIKTWLSSFYTR